MAYLLNWLILVTFTITASGCDLNKEMQEKENRISENSQEIQEKKTEQDVQNTEEIAKAAKLSPEQLQELMKIKNMRVIVPTNVPNNFVVHEIDINILEYDYSIKTNPNWYGIGYKSDIGSCFFISGFDRYTTPGMNGATAYESINLKSKALGDVRLEYTELNYADNSGKIYMYAWDNGKGNKGNWERDGSDETEQWISFYSENFQYTDDCEKVVTVQEAVQIIESLDYLN